ncbi:MAG: hypothetical protein JNL51_05355 [Chitinophagaceae bacterium]|nr:hypothetical protein [Chitinophagaceae bacterium]
MKTILPFKKALLVAPLTCLMFCFTAISGRAQCNNAPTLKFHSPVLIAGNDGKAGAIYLFANVIPGVDAHIEVMGLFGGATLDNIDDSTGIGYYDAFQPYVGAAPRDTSYIDWKITFKKAGTSTDTVLACVAVTGVDVDGDGTYLKEFIEAATPGSIATDPYTDLLVSFDGVRSKAISTVANVPLIDTAKRKNMFQMNFTNMSSLLYRNGAVSTYGAKQTRQTCIYFKPFFETYFLLPVRLLSFQAKATEKQVELSWSATNENDMQSYTLQKSIDGQSWTDITTIQRSAKAAISSYAAVDNEKNEGTVYYRLKQTDIKGDLSYSRILKIAGTDGDANKRIFHNTVFTNNLNLQVNSKAGEEYVFNVYSLQGARIKQQNHKLYEGMNSLTIQMPSTLSPGVYLLVAKDLQGRQVYAARIIRG